MGGEEVAERKKAEYANVDVELAYLQTPFLEDKVAAQGHGTPRLSIYSSRSCGLCT